MMDTTPPPKGSGKRKKAKKVADPRTLFVKFDPPSASVTRQHLSDHFSNYGPVNRCSVIRNKSAPPKAPVDEDGGEDGEGFVDRGTRGFGFVRFVHEDDAKAAADAIRQKLASPKKGKHHKQGGAGEVMIVEGVKYRIHAERHAEVDNNSGASASQQAKERKRRKVEEAVTPDAGDAAAPKTGADADAAPVVDESELEAKRKRTSRVIVRNLSFYADERIVRKAMEEAFGPVVAVDLPLVPSLPGEDGEGKRRLPRHRGFAFVTFENASHARKAVGCEAETKIKKRAVAIDYSVCKMVHQRMKAEEQKQKKDDVEKDEVSDGESDKDGSDNESDDESDDDSDKNSESDSDSESESEDNESTNSDEEGDEDDTPKKSKWQTNKDSYDPDTKAPEFDETEAQRTVFLRNLPFDTSRTDIFNLFRTCGRIDAVHLVKDRITRVFKGTAFVRFDKVDARDAALEKANGDIAGGSNGADEKFVTGKSLAADGASSGGLSLNGRRVLVDAAVDRTTASALAVQRDADGNPLKKTLGKDRRNLYLKNEGRVASSTDTAAAVEATAKRGGTWEDLPQGDQAKRERAFAEKSTKLRSPLFFLNPVRLSVRNLAKHCTESDLKKLAVKALSAGLESRLVDRSDAVAHWRAGGEVEYAEILRRATDPNLVVPPFSEKDVKRCIPSVFVDREVTESSDGKMRVVKADAAPSLGFGFVEFVHHAHALACLRELNNNPKYSADFAAGGKRAVEVAKKHRTKSDSGKKKKKSEEGDEFLGEDGKVLIPRLIVEFTVENKVKARQQAEKIAIKQANSIKQRIANKDKKKASEGDGDKANKKKKQSRGALQREKKRARKEAGIDGVGGDDTEKGDVRAPPKKSKKDSDNTKTDETPQKKAKKPKKKIKVDKDESALEDMIRSYKNTFAQGGDGGNDSKAKEDAKGGDEAKKHPRETVSKRRWFE